jgi:hypothetical protein
MTRKGNCAADTAFPRWAFVRNAWPRPDLCCPCAFLTGLSVGLLLAGSIALFEAGLGWAREARLVVAAGLLGLAVGSLIPVRVATLLSSKHPLMRRTALGDAPLMWTMLAVLSLAAGVAAALVPAWLPALHHGCHWLEGRFLWTPRVLQCARLTMATACLLPVVIPVGTALCCLHRLACPDRGWSVAPFGWGLLGAGAGGVAAAAAEGHGFPAEAACLLAAIPLLLVALGAGWWAGSAAEDSSASIPAAALPDLRDRSPILVRLTAAWLVVASGAVVVLWPQVWANRNGTDTSYPGYVTALLAAVSGVGLIVGQRWSRSQTPSIGGLGVCCAAAGGAVALSVGLPAVVFAADHWRPIWGVVPVVAGGTTALILGAAAAYGQLAILGRVGSRAAGGAGMLSISLAGAGAMLLIEGGLTSEFRASFAQLAGLALSLVAVGGTAIIHEPDCTPSRRRRRLAAVAVGVGLMVCGLPIAGRHWAQASPRQQTAVGQYNPSVRAVADTKLPG